MQHERSITYSRFPTAKLIEERDYQKKKIASYGNAVGWAHHKDAGLEKLRRIENEIAWRESGGERQRNRKMYGDGYFRAARSFNADGFQFARGCLVTKEQLASWPNGDRMLANGTICWTMTAPTVQPKPLAPKPEPVRKAPVIKIIPDADVIESWRLTKAAVVEQCGGDVKRAEDYLDGQDDTARLHQRAIYADAERRARANPSPVARREVRSI